MNDGNMKTSEKFIRINDKNININKLTANDMKEYIETMYPEDKKEFSEDVFKNGPVYNHFRAKNIFLKRYFPEVTGKKVEQENSAVQDFRSWLN